MVDIIEVVSRAVREVLAGTDVSQAWLFGSCARGEQGDDSDVDLRLVCGPSIRYGDLYEIGRRLEGVLGRPVQIITNAPDTMRPAFRNRLLADQVKVYEAA